MYKEKRQNNIDIENKRRKGDKKQGLLKALEIKPKIPQER